MTKQYLFKNVGTWIGVVLFSVALWVLRHELNQYRFHDIVQDFHAISWVSLCAALFFTVLDYGVITLCESLSLKYIQKPLRYSQIALTSFISYAFANSVGLSGLSGASIRGRFYSSWGFSAVEIAKIIAYVNLTFFLGLICLAGAMFVINPLQLPAGVHLPFTTSRSLGFVFLAVAFTYFVLIYFKKDAFKIKGWELSLPSFKLSLTQIGLTATDLILAGSVLYVLLPVEGKVGFPIFLTIYRS